ncbi:MAG: UPF0280 family protein [Rhodobacteraceae bacterium]|nr:UPF0280 family protein [Paracoccaceae bacterium]
MTGATASLLPDGKRLHLQHGPIDLIIGAEGRARERAFGAAIERFETILDELVSELPDLRRPLGGANFQSSVAQRMGAAVCPHSAEVFVTPMAAVAGSIADEVLASMSAAGPLKHAHVNNGGDIALYLSDGQSFSMAMAGLDGADLGRIRITSDDVSRGLATSGRGGRSMSLGIADSVTVLARTAAAADAAATLIANAVDLPGHEAITRRPACEIAPDSDLGTRLVVTYCGILTRKEVNTALTAGLHVSQAMQQVNLIHAASLHLRGESLQLSELMVEHA